MTFTVVGEVLRWLIVAIFGVVLTIILTIFLEDRIRWILLRLGGGVMPLRSHKVRGVWKAQYTYHSEEVPKGRVEVERHLIELRQSGRRVFGRNLTDGRRRYWYRIKGDLKQEMYLTGTWEWENGQAGGVYHGAFQLYVTPDGKRMEGKWIGFDRRNRIQDGPWIWEFITDSLDKKKRQTIVEEWQKADEP